MYGVAVACLASWEPPCSSELCGMSGRHLNLGDTTLTSPTSPSPFPVSQSPSLPVCRTRMRPASLCICRSCTNCSLTAQRSTDQAQGVTRVSIRPKRLGTRPCRLFSGPGRTGYERLDRVGRCPGPPSKQGAVARQDGDRAHAKDEQLPAKGGQPQLGWLGCAPGQLGSFPGRCCSRDAGDGMIEAEKRSE